MASLPDSSTQHRRQAQTSDGYVFYEQADGSWTDAPDAAASDLIYASLDALFSADPQLLVDGQVYSPIASAREHACGGSTPLRRAKPQ